MVIAKFDNAPPIPFNAQTDYPQFRDFVRGRAALSPTGLIPFAELHVPISHFDDAGLLTFLGLLQKSVKHLTSSIGLAVRAYCPYLYGQYRNSIGSEGTQALGRFLTQFRVNPSTSEPFVSCLDSAIRFNLFGLSADDFLAFSIRMRNLSLWPEKYRINFQSTTDFKRSTYDEITIHCRKALEAAVEIPANERVCPETSLIERVPALDAPTPNPTDISTVNVGVATVDMNSELPEAQVEGIARVRRTRCRSCGQLPEISRTPVFRITPCCAAAASVLTDISFPTQRHAITYWNACNRVAVR